MLRVVGLAKDIVAAVLDARGVVVPVGALVAGLVVDVHPDLGGRGDEHGRGDAGDGACTILLSVQVEWTSNAAHSASIVRRGTGGDAGKLRPPTPAPAPSAAEPTPPLTNQPPRSRK